MEQKHFTHQLADAFQQLPGIGPHQARRFVASLLEKDPACAQHLATLLFALHKNIKRCESCFWAFEGEGAACHICADAKRTSAQLLVVEKDTDLEAVERAGAYTHRYFVLGGTIAPGATNPEHGLRLRELYHRVAKTQPREVILALGASPEAETTILYITRMLEAPRTKNKALCITRLGRGLSTGAELEYSDTDTIAHALENRK